MASQTFTLKASLSCCSTCQLKAKRKLEKIKGVDSVTVNKDLVTISGSVNPSVAIGKFAKWGKTAELLSVGKEPDDDDDDQDNNNDTRSRDKKRCCRKSAAKKPRHQEQQQHSTMVLPTQGKNKSSWCWLRKKFGNLINPWHARSSAGPVGVFSPKKWSVPRTPMQEHGASMSPFSNQFFSPPLWHGRAPSPFYGWLPPPPYRVLPSAPPSVAYQPMTHYTSYADNYRPWYG